MGISRFIRDESRFIVISAMLFGLAGCGRIDPALLRSELDRALAAQEMPDPVVAKLVRQWYEARNYELSWADEDEATAVTNLIRSASAHGLDPERYGLSRLAAAPEAQASGDDEVRASASRDVRITAALLHLGRDTAIGRIRPSAISQPWTAARTLPDLVATLDEARQRRSLDGWLAAIAPAHAEYHQLRGWLAELHQSPARDPDGQAAARIAANLERLRWLPDAFGPRHLIVNIPEFMLRAREEGQTVLEMRVVVGKPGGNETPVLSGALESVVFNPFWNIPESILLTETLPAMEKDPDYLERNGMEIIRTSAGSSTELDAADVDWDDPDAVKRVRVRQRPGIKNALGAVKFPFRNEHAIYLHDTPSTALFAREHRAFSHGCVRVADPEALARYVLAGDPASTPESMAAAVRTSTETHVPVPEDIPVHLVYLTVVAGPDGQPRYLPDVYGYDRKQQALR